jgi:hypothetical protein
VKALATIATLLLTATAVAAQAPFEPTLPQADAQAAIGWQNLRADPTLSRNNWINSIFYADAAAGWYWNEHLRTQIDGGFGSTGRSTRISQIGSGTRPLYRIVNTEATPATLAISQQYQFFHNALFHPHVGAGVLVRSERLRDEYSPVTDFDPATGRTIVVEPGHAEERTRTTVAALADVGFKAYMNERAFFVTDARVTIRRGIDGVLLRFGFGLDF